MATAAYISMNGKIVPWDEARMHVYSPAVKYGAGVFEGIRGYWNDEREEMFVFRLAEHMERLEFSQRVMRFADIVPADALSRATLDVLRANEFRETVHIRPMVLVDGDGENNAAGPVTWCVVATPRPMPKRVETGCSVQVSSWTRISDRQTPPRVKANANYNNARFAAMQADNDGYDTALLLNLQGKVAEGPGMCFFMIRDGVPITPSVTSDILESITRATLLQLCREEFGVEPVERTVDRTEIYGCEEAFFCGTGWEITPITSVDRIPIGDGKTGAFTKRLQKLYFDMVFGRTPDRREWLTPVYGR